MLERTLGVPIFQEQAIKLAMVAAGFSGGEADQLRRAMASWGKNGNLMQFETKLVKGMLARGYDEDFAKRLFSQIKGFGGYGFPESHSASFALLAYVSAWFKRHHPAAFYCGLLNSQPMGFYYPLPADPGRPPPRGAGAAGGCQSQPLGPPVAGRCRALPAPGFAAGQGPEPGGRRAHHGRAAPGALSPTSATCGAGHNWTSATWKPWPTPTPCAGLSGHRHQAQWQILALEEKRPLLENEQHRPARYFNDEVELRAPAVAEEVLADYRSTGLTLQPPPHEPAA